MTWNWQQADWPDFRYKPEVLAALETRFLCQSGELCGAVKHLVQEDKQVLTVDLISDEALKTAAIEGEYLDRDILRSGPDGFAGGLSAEKYIRITRTSRATATRDLAELVAKQALKKTGQLKGTRYHLNLGH